MFTNVLYRRGGVDDKGVEEILPYQYKGQSDEEEKQQELEDEEDEDNNNNNNDNRNRNIKKSKKTGKAATLGKSPYILTKGSKRHWSDRSLVMAKRLSDKVIEYQMQIKDTDPQYAFLANKFDPDYEKPTQPTQRRRPKKKLGIRPPNIYTNYPAYISPILILSKKGEIKKKDKKTTKGTKEKQKSTKQSSKKTKKTKKNKKSLVLLYIIVHYCTLLYIVIHY